jgi:hypothetical protein
LLKTNTGVRLVKVGVINEQIAWPVKNVDWR